MLNAQPADKTILTFFIPVYCPAATHGSIGPANSATFVMPIDDDPVYLLEEKGLESYQEAVTARVFPSHIAVRLRLSRTSL